VRPASAGLLLAHDYKEGSMRIMIVIRPSCPN
jgi:hypothetical protein